MAVRALFVSHQAISVKTLTIPDIAFRLVSCRRLLTSWEYVNSSQSRQVFCERTRHKRSMSIYLGTKVLLFAWFLRVGFGRAISLYDPPNFIL